MSSFPELPLAELLSFEWPEGFSLGDTVRVRGRPETEGRIVNRVPPRDDLDAEIIEVKMFRNRKSFFACMNVLECKGVDYSAETGATAAARARTRRRRNE